MLMNAKIIPQFVPEAPIVQTPLVLTCVHVKRGTAEMEKLIVQVRNKYPIAQNHYLKENTKPGHELESCIVSPAV